MRTEDVVTGLRDLFGAEADLAVPEPSARPWAPNEAGVHGVIRTRVGDRNLIVKIADSAGIGQTLLPWIVHERGVRLPRPLTTFHAAAALSDAGERELAAYSLYALRDVLPGEVGRFGPALVLEDLGELAGLDPRAATARWSTEQIEQALIAAAGFHAATRGRDYPWTVQRPSTSTTWADRDLWHAMLDDAAARFPHIVTAQVQAARRATIDTIPEWHPAKDAMPATLVHNDFSQRNVGFRSAGETVVLDWGMSRVDTPQRDVAELLTFTLDAHSTVDEVLHLLAVHWQALADSGLEVDPELYARAAAAEFKVLSFDRVGLHLLLGAAFHLPYLERINRTVDHLVALTQE